MQQVNRRRLFKLAGISTVMAAGIGIPTVITLRNDRRDQFQGRRADHRVTPRIPVADVILGGLQRLVGSQSGGGRIRADPAPIVAAELHQVAVVVAESQVGAVNIDAVHHLIVIHKPEVGAFAEVTGAESRLPASTPGNIAV